MVDRQGGSYPVAARLLHCSRAWLAIGVPVSYFFAGLVCLLYDFGWPATVIIGAMHLIIVVSGRRDEGIHHKALLSFVVYIFLGLLIFLAVWISWRPAIYVHFPLALVGSVAWSITSWLCIVYVSFVHGQRGTVTETTIPIVTKADQSLVLVLLRKIDLA